MKMDGLVNKARQLITHFAFAGPIRLVKVAVPSLHPLPHPPQHTSEQCASYAWEIPLLGIHFRFRQSSLAATRLQSFFFSSFFPQRWPNEEESLVVLSDAFSWHSICCCCWWWFSSLPFALPSPALPCPALPCSTPTLLCSDLSLSLSLSLTSQTVAMDHNKPILVPVGSDSLGQIGECKGDGFHSPCQQITGSSLSLMNRGSLIVGWWPRDN